MSAPDTVVVRANHAPIVSTEVQRRTGVGTAMVVDGLSLSYERDQDSLSFAWTVALKPNESTAAALSIDGSRATFVPDVSGYYVIAVTASDWVASSKGEIVVDATGEVGPAPVMLLEATRIADRGARIRLRASQSYDPLGDELELSWTTQSSPELSDPLWWPDNPDQDFVAEAAGTYVFELTATAASGASSTETIAVEVVQPPVAPDVLDPGEVYLLGTDNDLGAPELVAHWSTPNSYNLSIAASRGRGAIHPASGRIVYVDAAAHLLREYHRDGGAEWLPGDPFGNFGDEIWQDDPIFGTPPCVPSANAVSGFVIAPTGEIFHRCADAEVWYDDAGRVVRQGGLTYAGYDGKGLTADAVVDLASAIETPITGIPSAAPLALRAAAGGFWLVLPGVAPNDAALWFVDDTTGQATQLGTGARLGYLVEHVGAGD